MPDPPPAFVTDDLAGFADALLQNGLRVRDR
jgi:hypothetical protein